MKKEQFPESDGADHAGGSRGSSQRLLLLVLLLLVAAFAYLYFFTGLIRPHGETATPPAPQAVQVRKPIPPRPVQNAMSTAAPAKQEEKTPVQAKTEKPSPAQVQAKPATPPVARTAAAPAQKAQTKPAPSPAAPPTAKPAAAPAQKAPVKVAKAETQAVRKEPAKAPSVPAQPAKPRQKEAAKPVPTAAAAAKKAPGQARATSEAAKPAAGQGLYTLLVGEFAVDREMRNTLARLKKLGISPVHEKRVTKSETMHRLFLADYDSHYAADQEMQKLENATGSAFILEENGRYAVYAGSYLHQKGADTERRRLGQKGFKVDIKTTKVMIPLTRVTAGPFSSNEEAEKESSRLKSHGIMAKVIKAGK